MKKIIILASERSGTNLLRILLGNHPDISAPVAPHFFDVFVDCVYNYGDLNEIDNYLKLLQDMTKLANHEYSNWKLSFDEVVTYISEKRTLQDAFDIMYTAMSKSEGKNNYFCKDNHMFDYIDLTERINGDVHYIYLYRDPRDHVISWLKNPIIMHTSYDIINKWQSEQKKILTLKNSFGLNFHAVSYESLLVKTKDEISAILDYVGLPIDKSCFSTSSNNDESKRNKLWENLSKPIMEKNFNKFKNGFFSPNDLEMIESIASKEMKLLGYNFETNASWQYKKKRGMSLILKISRIKSKYKHRKLLQSAVKGLESKRELIRAIRNKSN